MVTVCFGHIQFDIPVEVKGNKKAEEAIIYDDISTMIMAIPEVIKQYPDLKKSIKADTELLQTLLELGHIVAG